MVNNELPPYRWVEGPDFERLRNLIAPPEQFESYMVVIDALLLWKPRAVTYDLGERDPAVAGIRYLRTGEHMELRGKMPEMYLTFRIVREPPDGLIELRKIWTVADLRAGLHSDDAP